MKTIINFITKAGKAKDFPIGSLLLVTNGRYEGQIILSTYVGFILLNDPHTTWNKDCQLEVVILNPGESVTLIQE